jgi:hypothetical protein
LAGVLISGGARLFAVQNQIANDAVGIEILRTNSSNPSSGSGRLKK